MTLEEIDAWLARSLEDQKLSRSERQALGTIARASESPDELEMIRSRAFEMVRTASSDKDLINWLEGVLKAVREASQSRTQPSIAEAYFSPGATCLEAITRLLKGSRKSVDLCVFTITDDRLANVILDAHRRKVAVRVITDNLKAVDLGSDIERFEEAGILVRVDRTDYHMHHKFAIFDESTLLTGSYNWTRGAAANNEENLIVTDEPRLVGPFRSTFDRLWSSLA